ncbi:methyl-accepting chemotaxis protein methyltransferase [Gracilibacillus halophilus YIM-C55.5]|uniref:protein-glutamate O-methyltransferase n=1 Tax=Gracilibacillus halophilus YIM-C55.5 TaxID=1308866 RepID=N4WDK6_9BACI|nr:protein-glutamate O-methyltransferase CheR [Gracilibacillus halophilus]ENH97339.1 methyl-accepting chemotaxis protein methyltransferase [Gracilibacillus halophilus YIM-C55.5]
MEDYQRFVTGVYNKIGLDLSQYKEAQMKRRLTSLCSKKGYNNFSEFMDAMNKDQELFQEFLDKVTINVSEFYRNPSRWEVLENQLLPPLAKKKNKIRIWSAACSTGEEPYTLAIIANQFWNLDNIEIHATDIDQNVLARAKQGVYNERALQEVPADIKDAYFKKEGSTYKVIDQLKQSITFKQHNLLADSYPKSFDLIVCRNVLIYFTDEAKNQIYYDFSEALNPDGIFFVGSTEQIFNPEKYGFHVLDTFFYAKQT